MINPRIGHIEKIFSLLQILYEISYLIVSFQKQLFDYLIKYARNFASHVTYFFIFHLF